MSLRQEPVQRLGPILLASVATMMIVMGFDRTATAQDPNQECGSKTFSGCIDAGCAKATGTCASQNWDGQEREGFGYRWCNGLPGPCSGYQAGFVVCVNRFYLADLTGICATRKCTTESKVEGACAP